MRKWIRMGIVGVFLALFCAARASALIIDITPQSSGAVNPGDNVNIDVDFVDLDPLVPDIITAFTLILEFNPAVFMPTNVTFNDPTALMGFAFFDDSLSPFTFLTAGPGQVAFSALSLEFDPVIESLQTGITQFSAVTIGFQAIASGFSPFSILYDIGSGLDIKGANNVAYDVVVPEPGTLALLLTAGILAAGRKMQRKMGSQ